MIFIVFEGRGSLIMYTLKSIGNNKPSRGKPCLTCRHVDFSLLYSTKENLPVKFEGTNLFVLFSRSASSMFSLVCSF